MTQLDQLVQNLKFLGQRVSLEAINDYYSFTYSETAIDSVMSFSLLNPHVDEQSSDR